MTRFLTAAALLLSSLLAHAESVPCRVVAIADGDTLTCLAAGNQQIKVRLAEIDTPERGQPYGTRAQQELSDLAFAKNVTIHVSERDRYGRAVARVHANGIDVNVELVRRGAAWVYRDYLKDKSLLAVEEEARAARRGLWALPEAERMPPWEWRKAARDERAAERSQTPAAIPPRPAAPANPGFSCSPRKTCGQMSSCAEAMYHLQQCGNRRLDGDSDGVPCEKICG